MATSKFLKPPQEKKGLVSTCRKAVHPVLLKSCMVWM